jgi:hypothetical protein
MASAPPDAADFYGTQPVPKPHSEQPVPAPQAKPSRRTGPEPQRPLRPERPARAERPGRGEGSRKQWGRDRRTRAMPMVPAPVSDRRVAMARMAIIVTVTAWLAYLVTWFFDDFFQQVHVQDEQIPAHRHHFLRLQ